MNLAELSWPDIAALNRDTPVIFPVAALVAWLCSEDCSFTTGGVFDLSGGRATY